MILRADACVIGTGAGGAVAAAELAEGGMDVVVLEQGGQRSTQDATGRPRDVLPRFYRDGGQVATLGRSPLMLPLGQGTGGTTFVNSGTCFRTPRALLDHWRATIGIDLEERHFERVEHALGVSTVTPELAGRNAAIIRRGAERLGWSGGYLQRNARGCQGTGVCAFGCPTGAKQHAGEVYLPRALEAGARLITNARVQRIEHNDGRATGVTAGRGIRVQAPEVIVAAGAIHTPLLLAHSHLNHSPALGRNLTVHPATAVWGIFDEDVDMSRGVPQSYYVDEFAHEGFVLEGIAGPPDYLAMSAPFAGDELRELMLAHRKVAQCGLMISDRARGRVASVLGRPIVRYDLHPQDVTTVHTGLRRLSELMWAAGAKCVLLPVARLTRVHRADHHRLDDIDLRAGDLKLMGFHPLGTARAAAHATDGVVDRNLRVHGTRGIHAADSSAVPGPLGVNPQITIMALATRLAEHLTTAEEVAASRS
jgi:choline dehydrogenase-like flavoprotein